MKRPITKWAGTLAICVTAVFLFFALRVPQGFSGLRVKHQQIRQLEKENADLARENAAKSDRIRRLRDSTSEKEMEIRKRLKVQGQGDTTIFLPNDKPAK